MNAAQAIIQKFGGVRAMARKLQRQPSVVQYWSAKGYIPSKNVADIRAVAAKEGIHIDPAEFIEAA
jgi:hypothetical protein